MTLAFYSIHQPSITLISSTVQNNPFPCKLVMLAVLPKKYRLEFLPKTMDKDRFSQQMEFVAEIDKLKQVLRQTSLIDRSRQENAVEHSWHIAIMALLLGEYSNELDLDIFQVVKMLLIHDLVEIDAGDTFIYDHENTKDKLHRERRAASRIFGLLPRDQAENIMQIWEEFESMSTPEARFANALDAFHPVLLAHLNRGWSWQTHGIVKSQVIESKKSIGEGSKFLWEHTKVLIDNAVKNGYLKAE